MKSAKELVVIILMHIGLLVDGAVGYIGKLFGQEWRTYYFVPVPALGYAFTGGVTVLIAILFAVLV